MKQFTVTEDHLKLAKRMFVEWTDHAYEGAPYINIKRPYGNSDPLWDIAEALGWPIKPEHGLTEPQAAKAKELHRGMQHTLQIILCTQSFIPGIYRRQDDYDALSWELIA